MPLRFDLGPLEKLYIGRSVLTNFDSRTQFMMEGDTPILRAKDVLDPDSAVSPIERLYVCVQQMYLEEDTQKYQETYLALAAQSMLAEPAIAGDLQIVDRLLTDGDGYKALKSLKRLLRPGLFVAVRSDSERCVPHARRPGLFSPR